MPEEKRVSYSDAFGMLGERLLQRQTLPIGSFGEFVRDVWSQGYEHPEYFKAWHVGVVTDDVERCLADNKNYIAVLPRMALKSTVLGYAFCVWRGLKLLSQFGNSQQDVSILYLSYSDGMSAYHISEMKKRVRRNPVLTQWMHDRTPQADFSFRYFVGKKQFDIQHGGLFSFKRGSHVNSAMVADDLLRDPENPLNLNQLGKIEQHFLTESMFIPLRGVPVIVLGTPMAPGDLLVKLQSDDRFIARVLPAIDPVPGRHILWPEVYDEQWLLRQQQSNPRSFASEFLLTPYLSTASYFSDDEIRARENKDLASLSPYAKHPDLLDSDWTVAGFDVGKKRHPSHLVIFISKNGQLKQVCNMFLDGWDYTDQIELLNSVAENFDIDKGYVDNTRGELEERGLDFRWRPLTFTLKRKHQMAQIMERYIKERKVEFIADERQRSQITCVDGNLDAPDTVLGHGDAFFSIGMALLSHFETVSMGTTDLGDVNSDFGGGFAAPDLQKTKLAPPVLRYNENNESNIVGVPTVCPRCQESKGWIKERRLCLICNFRG